jgi:ANTAR domain-containing protein/GAF domain-containing protein
MLVRLAGDLQTVCPPLDDVPDFGKCGQLGRGADAQVVAFDARAGKAAQLSSQAEAWLTVSRYLLLAEELSMTPDTEDLAAVMTAVAATLRTPVDLDKALDRILASVIDTVPGVDQASLSVTTRDGRIETLAPTDDRVVLADQMQYELREGPCLQAALSDPVVEAADLATDLRWPVYGPRAAQLGFGAQIAFQFRAEPHARGALNLYADQPHSLDSETRALGAMFAGLVALAMGWARQEETVNQALATRNVIGQAIGIVMERYTIDPDQAFTFLVRTSQDSNTKLKTVADRIVGDAINTAQHKK